MRDMFDLSGLPAMNGSRAMPGAGSVDERDNGACRGALANPRHKAWMRALDFSWAQAACLFEAHLQTAR